MTTPIIIPKHELKAIALFASRDSMRFVLNSVLIEVGEHGVLLVATDGRRLAVLKVGSTQDIKALTRGSYILSTSFLKRAVVGTGEVSVTIEGSKVTIGDKDFSCSGKLLEVNYPNWRQVIPNGELITNSFIGVDMSLLTAYSTAAKMLTKSGAVRMSFAGGDNAPFIIRIPKRDDFYGVIMPYRVDAVEPKNPVWLKEAEAAKTETK